MTENIVAEAANDYLSAGWQPLPLRPLSKIPVVSEWQYSRVTVEEIPNLFPPDANIGLLLGSASNDLVDVDLDSQEAIALALAFLPVTKFVSGRASKPRSHFWYRAEPVPKHRKFEFDGECLLELRTTGQTMTAPSVHPSGEQVIWHESEGELPKTSGDELSRITSELAAATLLVKRYPEVGGRHSFALMLSGFLLRQGWSAEKTVHFITAVARAAGDNEIEDRKTAVTTTADRLAAGEPALGGPRLTEIVGREAFEKLSTWLGFARSRFEILPYVEAANIELETIPDWPLDCLEGDYIADLAFTLFHGTSIPPQFLRESAALVLGALVESKVGFPLHRGLPSRRYLLLASERAQSGKGESWKRIGGLTPEGAALRPLIEPHGLKVLNGSGIGSGQYLAKALEENPRAIVYWDEASQLFATASQENSNLFSAVKSLFEQTSHWTGSFVNKRHGGDDLHLSVLIHATRKTFSQGFSLRGGIGDGLLSRFTLAYCDRVQVQPVWAERDFSEEGRIAQRISELIPQNFVALEIEPDASERMKEFARTILSPEHEHPDHTRRLLELTKVDCLLRCIFSGSTTITLEMMERAILWGKHQLALRLHLWPSDAGSRTEAITQTLLRRLRKGSASTNDLRRAANVDRDGSHESFARALSALRRSGALVILGRNRKQQDIYGLESDDARI